MHSYNELVLLLTVSSLCAKHCCCCFSLKPRLTLFNAKMVHADVGKYRSFSSLSFCNRELLPACSARKWGQRLPCCISMAGYLFWPPEKKPLLQEMQIHNTTHTHKLLLHTYDTNEHTHTIPPKQNTNRQVNTKTRIHSCNCRTIRPALYNGAVWMGSNNGALWHLNRARWWVSQEAE